jgi:hypothetical protein
MRLNKTKYILVGFVVLRILSVFFSKRRANIKGICDKEVKRGIKIELFSIIGTDKLWIIK